MTGDSYPTVGFNDFIAFTKATGIECEQMTQAMNEIAWTAVLAGKRAVGAAPMTMWRHEFLEALVRMAVTKYKMVAPGLPPHQALEQLIRMVVTNYTPAPWQEFRDTFLWTNGVDYLFKANSKDLEAIHAAMFPRIAEVHPIASLTDLLRERAGLGISLPEVRYCFGMSKMTVKDEIGQRQEYDRLRHPEFLEFLGRVAHALWPTEEGVELHEKLYRVLDKMLKVFGMRVKAPDEADQDDITSEESINASDTSDSEAEQKGRRPNDPNMSKIFKNGQPSNALQA